MSIATHKKAITRVNGMNSFKTFVCKYPFQYSDKADPVAKYSQLFREMQSQQSIDNMRTLSMEACSIEDEGQASNLLAEKRFIDTKSNERWRSISIKQMDLSNVTDNNLLESTMVQRRSEDEILEQASIVIGQFPFHPEIEQKVIDIMNIINGTGNLSQRL